MRTGFTLIEVLVAMTLAVAILLGADAVFEQLADSRAAMARVASDNDRDRNSRGIVARWVRQLDVSPTAAPGAQPHSFGGDDHTATFTSWCLVAGGWERECQITLTATADTSGAAIVATSSNADSARFALRGSSPSLRYLLDARDGGHWLKAWGLGPAAPLAIAVVSGTDTLVWRVGARG